MLHSRLPTLVLCTLMGGAASAETLSTYGSPGLVDVPSAYVLPDGNLAVTTNRVADISKNSLTFQLTPRAYGTFRYSVNRDFFESSANVSSINLYDRSFDFHYQIATETNTRPAIAVGLRDFGGTGVLSSEYIVATKRLTPQVTVTGGLGWGRLAQRNAFDNPFGVFSDAFDTRVTRTTDGPNTGQLDFGAWFRGPAAVFGGIEYQASERLRFQLEYSSDQYDVEAGRDVISIESPINVGASYDYPNGSQLRAFFIGGNEIGVQYSYVLDPVRRPAPGGLDSAPIPVIARGDALLGARDLRQPDTRRSAEAALDQLLRNEGMVLQGLTQSGEQATIKIENNRWDIAAQGVGRAARAMAAVLPANIDVFVITIQTRGVPISSVTLNRSDLEELETDFDGAWRSLARAQISDAAPDGRAGELDTAFPAFSYGISPYTVFSFFDPNSPVRYDAGVQLNVAYRPAPGLTFSGLFRQPLTGNIADATRRSNSAIQRVRSDSVLYAIESDFEINNLTAEYLFRPGPDLFGRVTAGYLENMYGGLSTEVLWYPIDSRWALGAELNYVKQRDFDMLLGFQDYEVLTGHASAYYDFGNGYTSQVDVGRYLAGDWGATVGLDREFNNGFKVGAYFTLTDVPFDDFGEGSFDKGIRISIPLSWVTGKSSQDSINQVIQPVLRDGGARLNVNNRLYGVTRDYRAEELGDGWGRFYR